MVDRVFATLIMGSAATILIAAIKLRLGNRKPPRRSEIRQGKGAGCGGSGHDTIGRTLHRRERFNPKPPVARWNLDFAAGNMRRI